MANTRNSLNREHVELFLFLLSSMWKVSEKCGVSLEMEGASKVSTYIFVSVAREAAVHRFMLRLPRFDRFVQQYRYKVLS